MMSATPKHRVAPARLALAVMIALAPVASVSAQSAARTNVHVDSIRAGGTYDGVIVKYRTNSTAAKAGQAGAAVRAERLAAASKAAGVALRGEQTLATGAQLLQVAAKSMTAEQTLELVAALAADPDVEYVQPNGRKYAALTPNDTHYPKQWHYFSTGWGMNLPPAWDIATGAGITVAVLDTGITSHPDLTPNVVAGYDFISNATTARDGNGRDNNPADEGDWFAVGDCPGPAANQSRDSSWHGTHVAGTVAAVSNNASGVTGVAFGAKLQPVRVLGRCGGTDADIVQAITWASGGAVSGVPANATPSKVINMSLGGEGTCDPATQDAINGAVARGSVVVVAAGNDTDDAANYSPASCNNVINVAAIGPAGTRAGYSNFGSKIDVAAPGGSGEAPAEDNILSTVNTGTTVPAAAGYGWNAGTSMASPHVAGLAALVMQRNPGITPAAVEQQIKQTARLIPTANCPEGCGAGAVDAARALGLVIENIVQLQNGVASPGHSAAAGSSRDFRINVPAGARNLVVTTAGTNGDADLYVKFNTMPTTTSYDCRGYTGTSNETCTIATPSAGSYLIKAHAYRAYSGLTVTARYDTTSGNVFTNATDYTIADNATVDSPITVSGRTGNAPSTLKVTVGIVHTYIGDLKVDLVAPDGTLYNLHNRSGGTTDNINATYTVNASSEVANGTWKLRVNDNASGDTGRIDTWSLTF